MKHEVLIPKRTFRHLFSPLRKMHSISLGVIGAASQQITDETNMDGAKARIDMTKTKTLQVSSRLTFV